MKFALKLINQASLYELAQSICAQYLVYISQKGYLKFYFKIGLTQEVLLIKASLPVKAVQKKFLFLQNFHQSQNSTEWFIFVKDKNYWLSGSLF